VTIKDRIELADTNEAINDEVDELEVADLLTIHASMSEEGFWTTLLRAVPAVGDAPEHVTPVAPGIQPEEANGCWRFRRNDRRSRPMALVVPWSAREYSAR
jgi:hypothetical protein